MAEWEGWSTNQRRVDLNRVVRSMVDREDAGEEVPLPAVAAADLELTPDHDTTNRLTIDLLAGDAGYVRAIGDGGWNIAGRAVAEQFRTAAGRWPRARGARMAILLWLDDHHADHMPALDQMLREPHSWFWGTQFSIDELDGAAGNLAERGYVNALPAWNRKAVRVGLTDVGDDCVEKFAGDPDEMERQMTDRQPNIAIGNYNQSGGNSAIGSQDFTQTATTMMGHNAAELLAFLTALREAGDIPAELLEETEAAEADLREADADASAVVAVRRAGGVLNRLAESPLGKPVIAAALPLIVKLIEGWQHLS